MATAKGSNGPTQPLSQTQSTMPEPIRWHAATRELVGGVIAGAVNVTSGYPFDTVKVRLQAGDGAYEGMTDCFVHIWRTEGVSKQLSSCAEQLRAEQLIVITYRRLHISLYSRHASIQ